jgi:long-subunit acyl-CoA synthetase (AMP-forming)
MNFDQQSILTSIAQFALKTPNKTALQGRDSSLSYVQLAISIELAAYKLNDAATSVLGIAMDNSPAWAIVDLAAMQLNLPVVPLPHFFSAEQTMHAINDANINVILSDQPIFLKQLFDFHDKRIVSEKKYLIGDRLLTEFILHVDEMRELPSGTAKITYTSGTTGKPKGVCLDAKTLNQVSLSLLEATRARPTDRHLSILPLSTLLENIAGLYVPLLAGATTMLLPSTQTGLMGSTGLNIQTLMATFSASKATTAVLTPELLLALVLAIEAGFPKPASLRFVAVGGASVSPQLLNRAIAIDLPVFEGYGLSECGSVVALNTPKNNKIGSVGKPLPHVTVKLGGYGEILVKGGNLLGYVGSTDSSHQTHYLPTGDIGHFDDDGYLYISGRKKNQFITSYGRNVSPEWVERELTLSSYIAQAAVFGEAKPWNVAVIVPAKNASQEQIDISIAVINQILPDYARVSKWIIAGAAFTPQNEQLTSNGRLRREVVWQNYQQKINEQYHTENRERSYAVL